MTAAVTGMDSSTPIPPTRLIALGVVLVCLVVFGMGRHYGKQRQMYRRQLKEANALLYAGKTADAGGAYDNLIEIDKKRVEGYEGGAAALVAEKRLDQARQYLKKAAKIKRTLYQLAIAANLDLARDQKAAAQRNRLGFLQIRQIFSFFGNGRRFIGFKRRSGHRLFFQYRRCRTVIQSIRNGGGHAIFR